MSFHVPADFPIVEVICSQRHHRGWWKRVISYYLLLAVSTETVKMINYMVGLRVGRGTITTIKQVDGNSKKNYFSREHSYHKTVKKYL